MKDAKRSLQQLASKTIPFPLGKTQKEVNNRITTTRKHHLKVLQCCVVHCFVTLSDTQRIAATKVRTIFFKGMVLVVWSSLLSSPFFFLLLDYPLH